MWYIGWNRDEEGMLWTCWMTESWCSFFPHGFFKFIEWYYTYCTYRLGVNDTKSTMTTRFDSLSLTKAQLRQEIHIEISLAFNFVCCKKKNRKKGLSLSWNNPFIDFWTKSQFQLENVFHQDHTQKLRHPLLLHQWSLQKFYRGASFSLATETNVD